MAQYQKTENFFTRNVRLITFLVTLGVFLALFLPIAIPKVREYWGQEVDTRDKLTLQRLVTLSEQKDGIALRQLTEYQCEEQEKDFEIWCYIDVEPCYQVLAVADKKTRLVVYCTLLNVDTGESVDVLTEDIRAYVNGISQK